MYLKKAAAEQSLNIPPSKLDPFAPLFSSMKDEDSEADEKLSRVFKAINVGDLPLVAFYIGIEKYLPPREPFFAVEVECHPFCDCVKCSSPVSRNQVRWNLLHEITVILSVA